MQSTANKKKSGEHDPNFSNYCLGRLDVLYMHYWMEAKPGLENFVEGKCPLNARLDTLTGWVDSKPSARGTKRSPDLASPEFLKNDPLGFETPLGSKKNSEHFFQKCQI